MTELIALAQEWGWSKEDLARELGIARTTLAHQRVGRHALKTAMLSRIARRFRNDRTVRDLVWHYLTVEYEEGTQRTALPPLPRVPDAVAGSLRAYIARFSEESVHGGRGLYLVSTDAALLSATLQWLQRTFTQQRIDPCLLRADRPVSATESRFALAAPILLLERIDFMKEPVAEVMRRRADLVRPMIVTSTKHPDTVADPYLRRVVTSMTRLLEIGSPPSSLPTTNGPVPAESEQQ